MATAADDGFHGDNATQRAQEITLAQRPPTSLAKPARVIETERGGTLGDMLLARQPHEGFTEVASTNGHYGVAL